MIRTLLKSFSGINELVLVACMVGVLLILFTPISPTLLDFLLLVNFATALLILLVTFYTDKPLSFSTFPSLLLMTTLFRLALNISATRLILDNAHAGKVIDAVGNQVVGGNYIIGLVVFLILIVVQFVVVTSGAQRVAEVAARFILDSLPGKQMSIDADLNMGLIDQEEAKRKRGQLEKESNFYGAMDGASKFVKGDAIAGIIIILIDIIGGLTIGIAQLGMNWSEALHVYTLLTVGDGIVTQIPSLIIAVSAGIIITRAATDSRLANEITHQFSAHPKTIAIAALALAGLGFVPGIPLLPVLMIVVVLAVMAWLSYRKNAALGENGEDADEELAATDPADSKPRRPMPFQIRFGSELSAFYVENAEGLDSKVEMLKSQFMDSMGIELPTLTIKKNTNSKPDSYAIVLQGVVVGRGALKLDKLLAIYSTPKKPSIPGEPTIEPTYGLQALWISPEDKEQALAEKCTLVEAETVLITHLQEVCKRQAADFITRSTTEKMIEAQRDDLPSLIDELIPSILTYSDVQKVLQGLVSEGVSIFNMEAILEVLVDEGRNLKDADQLIEKVRQKICGSICSELVDDNGTLNTITLAPNLERKFILAGDKESSGTGLSPQELDAFISKIATEYEKQLGRGVHPVLLCAAPIRRLLKNLLFRACPQLHVLSTHEIARQTNIAAAGIIDIAAAAGIVDIVKKPGQEVRPST